jgi:hypothetical protein
MTLCVPPEADDATLGERLLCELMDVFREELDVLRRSFPQADAVSSQAIVTKLCALPEAPWGDLPDGQRLNQRMLARLLRPYGIKPKTVRIGGTTPRGYERAHLYDAWIRYCAIPEPTQRQKGP